MYFNASFEVERQRQRNARPGHTIDVDIEVDGEWYHLAQLGPAGSAPVQSNDFTVKVQNDNGISLTVRRRDNQPLRAQRLRATFSTPLLNFAGVIVPDCGRHYVLMSKGIDSRIAQHRIHSAMCGNAFLALADERGEFHVAFGVLTAPGDVEIRRVLPRISNRKAMVGGDELLSLEFSWAAPQDAPDTLDIALYLAEQQKTWVHALREYASLIKQREQIKYPQNPAAWDPTWCTWTAFCSSEMTSQRVLENARLCKDLGIGTIILDDGWFGPGLDDDPADVADTLNLGDYFPDTSKFPDLKALIRQIHDLGLKVLLWHAPHAVARSSKKYPEVKRFMLHRGGREFTSMNGLAQLCPASPEVREQVRRETTRLLQEYGADGLKVDLYNNLADAMCDSTEHQHDTTDSVDAVNRCMQSQWNHALAINPDVIFELKQDYGNVRLARHGTMVRAGDTAYDVDTNLRRCFYIQALGYPVHNDYLVTSVHADPEAMSLLLIRNLVAGVPTFGIDLVRISQQLRDVIKYWLGFYNAHRAMFQQPREPQRNDLSAWQGGDEKLAWVAPVWQCREITLPRSRKIFILNGTGHSELLLRSETTVDAPPRRARLLVQDHRGNTLTEKRSLSLTDGATLPIRPGALATLTLPRPRARAPER